MRALALTGQGRREHCVALRAQQFRDARVAPATAPCAVHQDESGRIACCLHKGSLMRDRRNWHPVCVLAMTGYETRKSRRKTEPSRFRFVTMRDMIRQAGGLPDQRNS